MKKFNKFTAILAAGLTAASLIVGTATVFADSDVTVVKGVTGGSLAPYFYVGEDDELTGVDIDIVKEGKDILIGFNPKFFIDALRVIDEEEVSLYMVNPKAPCFIKDDEGKFIYLILPVNFNASTV